MAHCVTALHTAHELSGFDCGSPALNAWLKTTAGQHQKKLISKTWVLIDDQAAETIVGFFTLAIRPMTPRDAMPEKIAKRLPGTIPGYTLARLAVSNEHQGKGLGALLLMEAMQRVRVAASAAGGVALFVDAKDATAAQFYRHYGFTPLVSDPLILMFPVAQIPA